MFLFLANFCILATKRKASATDSKMVFMGICKIIRKKELNFPFLDTRF
jgi:hypothetical protein